MQGNFEKLPRVAFWLVPQLIDRQKLEEHMASLAREFSSPQFVPHVTLYSCYRTPQQQELKLLARLAAGSKPVTLQAEGLCGKERLSQALYVDLKNDESSCHLYYAFAKGVTKPSEYIFDPHLSLLYQDLSVSERERVQSQLKIDLAEIRFDQLWAVAIPETLSVLKDFTNWQTLMICRLDSDENAVTL